MPDVEAQIEENAVNPKKMQADGQTVEEHSLPDQIAAAEFKQANAAVRSRTPFRKTRIVPGESY